MPTNLYGPGDNFDLHELTCAAGADPQVPRGEAAAGAPSVEVWGTGTPRREFLHVDDLADACLFLMDSYRTKRLSTSAGDGCDHRGAGAHVADIVGYSGWLRFDPSRPDGPPRKLLDTTRPSRPWVGRPTSGWKPESHDLRVVSGESRRRQELRRMPPRLRRDARLSVQSRFDVVVPEVTGPLLLTLMKDQGLGPCATLCNRNERSSGCAWH